MVLGKVVDKPVLPRVKPLVRGLSKVSQDESFPQNKKM